jgi:hypothetical protein
VGLVSFALTALPLLSWARDEFLSSDAQAKLKIPKLLPHWHWWVWVVVSLSVLLLVLLESAYRVVHGIETETEKEHGALLGEIKKEQESKSSAETRLQELLNAKPSINCQFDYSGQQAVLAVTNSGPIADVWASLRVRGMLRSGVGHFARWSHSRSYKIKIAKGETHHLLLAALNIQNGEISTWVVHFATESDVGMTEASQSSLFRRRDDGQADDIDLYIKLFSDPECVELRKEWHVVLHSNAAELGH